ncbi:MAG: hypothetical protein DRJ01_01345 [Bacteroidetes bacterium]|nr:MAG: hypothetical protein DRJ01_01345 [Bacteroidota bacterium]
MKKILFIFLVFISACTGKIEKRVVSTFDNGNPKKIEYYKIKSNNKVIVKEENYYSNGKIKMSGDFYNNKRDGKWIVWYENGNKWSEGYFKNGLRDKESTIWYENGNKQIHGFYKDGKTDKTWTFWNKDAEIVKEVVFKDGVKIKEKEYSKKIPLK